MSLIVLAALAFAPFQSPDPPTMNAVRVEAGEVRLDGRLDEPVWARAIS